MRAATRTILACGLIATLLLAQGLWSLPSMIALSVPHEALDECARHKCGCDPDKSKRKSCCCYPDRSQAAATESAPQENGLARVLIASAECKGGDGMPLVGVAKMNFVPGALIVVANEPVRVADFAPESRIPLSRYLKPLIPPPRRSLLA